MRSRLEFKRIAALTLLSSALLATSAGRLMAQTQAAPAQSASTLTVRVTGIRNTKGKISLALYRDSKWVENREAEIDAKTLSATAIFEELPHGVYAVNLFHDENMNGKMDTNFLGVPVEGYGFSVSVRLWPPGQTQRVGRVCMAGHSLNATISQRSSRFSRSN